MPSTSTKNDSRRPKRQADFDLWARKAYWSAFEAAVLSFAQDPDDFQSMVPEQITELLEFPNLHHRIDDIERAEKSRGKPRGLSPAEFHEWASSVNLELPKELKAAIERVAGAQNDWRTKYESEHAKVEEFRRKLDEQETIIAMLKKHEREDRRRSLQRLVIGMAMAKYAYKMDGKRSTATANIAKDLRSLQDEHATDGPPLSDIALDEDTIRHHLETARQELSGG